MWAWASGSPERRICRPQRSPQVRCLPEVGPVGRNCRSGTRCGSPCRASPDSFLALCRNREDAVVYRHVDVTIWVDPWQLSPDHQMVALDELLHLDEFFGVEEWPPGRTQAGPQVLQISWSPCADHQILICRSGLRVWEGRMTYGPLAALGEMRHDRTPQQVRGTGSTMVWRQTAFDLDGAGVLNDHRRPAVLGSLHAPIGHGQESGPVHAYDVFTGLWQGHG